MSVVYQEERIHEGNNLKRVREIIGMKQEALGQACPSKFTQQRVSEYEKQWVIEMPAFEELADALGVSVEFIRAFNEEKAIFNIQNNKDTSSKNTNYIHTAIYEPIDKVVNLLEKLYEEDKVKTQAILDLGKMVSDLAKEVQKLKEGK